MGVFRWGWERLNAGAGSLVSLWKTVLYLGPEMFTSTDFVGSFSEDVDIVSQLELGLSTLRQCYSTKDIEKASETYGGK